MRICFRHLKPRPSQRVPIHLAVLRSFFASSQCLASSPPCRYPPSFIRSFSTQSTYLDVSDSLAWDAVRPSRADERAQLDAEDSSGVGNGNETDNGQLRPPKAELQNPDSWISLLERFLPAQSAQSCVKPNPRPLRSDNSCTEILAVLYEASSKANTGIDLLAHLSLKLRRWQAALDLVNILLQNVAAKVPSQPAKPSLPGLLWPRSPSLEELCSEPIYVHATDTIAKEDTASWNRRTLDPRYLEIMSKDQDRTMSQIWKSLGYTIIEATELEGEEADAAMRFVYRVIAQIHKLGLVPDNVYAYGPSNYTSSVTRPPIMHLLSSRILTTLSDAVWRAHQDDVIAQAVSSGIAYKDLGHDPPGGRFRLKVRSLGPEVWLEFVLWCCIDGGFASTGTKIVERLRERVDKPWFAVNWTLSTLNSSTASKVQNPAVDWNRVQLRTGGTVGRVEGYSAEQPFAVMDPRTISTEVVLALVDSLTNSLNVGVANRGSSLKKVQNSIRSLISFLEPHRLPLGYFDHLAVRLHQSGSFDPDRSPEDLQSLAQTFLYLRSLKTAEEAVTSPLSFGLEAIATHSEFLNGLFHQSLEAFVNLGDIRRALDAFAQIQQLVDSSKLRSISMFLSNPPRQPQGYFSSRIVAVDKEFVVSHGQLPIYKLTAFLDLVTDSGLVRLGNWLVYSEDVDGPLIPESSYAIHCISPALIRFAAVSQDHELMKKVMKASLDQPVFPSVTLFRALANTNIAFSQYSYADKILKRLRVAKAGGFSPENLASLAAAILSLEVRIVSSEDLDARMQVQAARRVMGNLLEGFYDGNTGVYRDSQRALTQRQVASILRVLECVPETQLSDVAHSWRSRFDSGNEVNLYTADFNVLLAAIVETKGASVGKMIWDLFCEDPRERFNRARIYSGSYFFPGLTEDDENEWDDGHLLRNIDERQTTVYGYPHIPVVAVDQLPLDGFENAVSDAPASDIIYEEAEEEQAAPRSNGIISFDPKLSGHDTLHPFIRTTPDSDTGHSPSPSASVLNPVVPPNLRTLRLIVRGALNERRKRQALGQDTSEQQEILTWSKQFFRAFGLRGKAIQQEIQSFLDEDGVSEHTGLSLAEEKRLYDEARRKRRLREPRPVTVSPKFLSGSQVAKPLRPLIRHTETKKPPRLLRYVPLGIDLGQERAEEPQADSETMHEDS